MVMLNLMLGTIVLTYILQFKTTQEMSLQLLLSLTVLTIMMLTTPQSLGHLPLVIVFISQLLLMANKVTNSLSKVVQLLFLTTNLLLTLSLMVNLTTLFTKVLYNVKKLEVLYSTVLLLMTIKLTTLTTP